MRREHAPFAGILLALAGNAALACAPGASWLLLGLVSGALLVWAYVERRVSVRIPPNVARALDLTGATILVALASVHFALQYRALLSIGHLLALWQLGRLFRRKTSKDLMILNGTALAQTALAAFLCERSDFVALLLAAVVLGALASMQVVARPGTGMKGVRIFVGRSRNRRGVVARMASITQVATLGGSVLLMGAALFVILPRGAPFDQRDPRIRRQAVIDPTDYSQDEEEATKITGFSESVKLGDVGRIKIVPWAAFTVAPYVRGLPTRLPDRLLYFRGASLDQFTGREWVSSPSTHSGRRWLTARGGVGRIPLRGPVPEARAGFRVVLQEYRLKASVSSVLFALDGPVSVELTPDLPRVLVDGSYCLQAPQPHGEAFFYRVSSCVPSDPERRILVEPLSPEEREACLSLPEGLERLTALADEVAGQGSPLERASRLVAHLGEGFEYTLLFIDDPGGNPIESFVFDTRAGHCEYFASALALMLRGAGIPSRLVVGYRGGQWFEDEGLYLVRQSSAHAWVEAYLPDRGWVRLDPTPGDEQAVTVPPTRVPGRIEVPGVTSDASQLLSLVRDFDIRDRRAMLRGVGDGVSFIVREGFGIDRPHRGFPPPLTFLLLGGTVVVLGRRLIRGRGRGTTGRSLRAGGTGAGPRAMPPFYEAALAALAAQGLHRSAPQSPREFEIRVRETLGSASAGFDRITRCFEESRYGGLDLPEDALRELQDLAGALRGS